MRPPTRDIKEKKLDAIRIRPARLHDTNAIYAVHTASIRELCRDHYSPSDIESWTDLLAPKLYEDVIKKREIVVAEDGGTIVGFGMMDPEIPLIKALYIAPESSRRGVGSKIARRLERTARDKGREIIYLRATLNAVPFYERLGYVGKGEEQHVLSNGVALACVSMSKRIRED